jgi:hypothetical protein
MKCAVSEFWKVAPSLLQSAFVVYACSVIVRSSSAKIRHNEMQRLAWPTDTCIVYASSGMLSRPSRRDDHCESGYKARSVGTDSAKVSSSQPSPSRYRNPPSGQTAKFGRIQGRFIQSLGAGDIACDLGRCRRSRAR